MNSRQTIRTAVVALLLSATVFGAMNVSSQAAVRGGGNGGGNSSGSSGPSGPSGGQGGHGTTDPDSTFYVNVPPPRYRAPVVVDTVQTPGHCQSRRFLDEDGNAIVTRNCDYRAESFD